jgi:hypothetical protein
MTYSNALDPKHNERVYARLQSRVAVGVKEQKALIDRVVAMVIRDKLVAPSAMKFDVVDGHLSLVYPNERCTIHRHALNQLAAKVELPMGYVSKLNDGPQPDSWTWKRELLAHNLRELYSKTSFYDKGGSPKFLHRIVGTELRGFLSRRFNRHLASAPLLRSFLDTCQEVGAEPVEAIATDVRLGMRCFLPYIFEPLPGEYIAVGADWSNSDFGAGRLSVSICLWMAASDRSAVLDKAISRVHIGSVIEDADIEMSDDTYLKEAETQAMAIADTVRSQLSVESVERLLEAVVLAREEEIPWYRLRGQLARFLNKKEMESLKQCLDDEVIDLPPVGKDDQGRPLANAYWAMAALSKLASKTDDQDRKIELQHAAGSLIQVKAA